MTKRHEITVKIECDNDPDGDEWDRVMFYDETGKFVNFQPIGPVNSYRAKDVRDATWSLAHSLYFNSNYAEYQNALYPLAFPYGEW